jgi:flavodoxin
MNTEKVAKVIADVLQADLKEPKETEVEDLSSYDLIGFGSGIYFSKHHRELLEFAERLPRAKKKAFIFSTAGFPSTKWHGVLREILKSKGFEILGEFCCRGFNTHSILRFIGGMNKGRPNEEDLEKARKFAEEIKREFTLPYALRDPQ